MRAEAEKFIQFVLSPAGQQAMQTGDPTGDSLFYPVLHGVNPLPGLPSMASVKTADHRPVQVGTAGSDHQHLVRREHRPMTLRS